jgi:phage baseplate assembly protein W
MDSRTLLGAGWGFPFEVDGRGGIGLMAAEQAIDRSIVLILSTAKGERRMRPTFGCDIHDMVFAPDNATTRGLIQAQVLEALAMWEPRIEVESVDVEADPEEDARLLITVNYTIKTTSDERSLVYPFYVIPGEP